MKKIKKEFIIKLLKHNGGYMNLNVKHIIKNIDFKPIISKALYNFYNYKPIDGTDELLEDIKEEIMIYKENNDILNNKEELDFIINETAKIMKNKFQLLKDFYKIIEII